MNLNQRITASNLAADGFTISISQAGLIAVRGNGYRIIHADGSQHRAKGAKK